MAGDVIGIDLGGTNIRVGLVDEAGTVVRSVKAPTDAETRDGLAIIERIGELIDECRGSEENVVGIGLGIPGPLDPANGGVKNPPNLGQLDGLPIRDLLSDRSGLPVSIENDANAAAWGEFWIGAGRPVKTAVLATLGTGIGGGIIINGQLLRGIDHTAGELGHIIVVDGGRPCNCGSHGCIEAYASADSTVRRFREAVKAGGGSKLGHLKRRELTCEMIFDAARDSDKLALEVVSETGRLLGVMAATLANLLNPERLIFSGGMINAGALLFDAIRDELDRRAFATPAKRMEIVPAELGADAGLIGAAGCALTAFVTSQS